MRAVRPSRRLNPGDLRCVHHEVVEVREGGLRRRPRPGDARHVTRAHDAPERVGPHNGNNLGRCHRHVDAKELVDERPRPGRGRKVRGVSGARRLVNPPCRKWEHEGLDGAIQLQCSTAR